MRELTRASVDHLGDAAAKVKQRVLPLFILMVIVNYLDRVNVGFIQKHLRTDLGLESAAYGLFGLACASVLAAALVFLALTKPKA